MLAGAWSGRIREEHGLVYLVDGDDLVILQADLHSSDRPHLPLQVTACICREASSQPRLTTTCVLGDDELVEHRLA